MSFDTLSNPPSGYEYKPLDPSSKEIRLVVFEPALNRPVEKIECSIIHTSLDDPTPYRALSYTWGDPSDRRPVWLDGRRFEVTRNLEEALRHICDCNHPVAIWIDAICINQADVAERSSQVALMRDIFSGAHEVLAWVGPQASDRERKALELVQEVYLHVFDNNSMQVTEEISAWISTTVSPGFRDCSWGALADLLDRPWFSRIWVVQEVAVAKSVKLVCGKLAMDWRIIASTIAGVYAYMMTVFEAASRGLADNVDPDACQKLHEVGQRLFDGFYNIQTISASHFRLGRENKPASFYDIMKRFTGRKSTDPRDKIFALLGLASESQLRAAVPIPDYSMSVEDVFWEMARLHLEEHKTLDILSGCCGPDPPEGFSSWMPHWQFAKPDRGILFLEVEPDIMFRASGSSAPSLSLSKQDKTLFIKGIPIDSIETVGEIYDLLPGQSLAGEPYTPGAVRRHWASLVHLHDFFFPPTDTATPSALEAAKSAYVGGGLTAAAFLRTTLMNPSHELNTSYFSRASGVAAEPRFLAPDLGEGDAHLRGRVAHACDGRRFFVTARGYMGVAHPEVRRGDVVCVFLGAKAPHVVREGGDGAVLLVGEAYVQGLMDGEAVGELARGGVECREFELR